MTDWRLTTLQLAEEGDWEGVLLASAPALLPAGSRRTPLDRAVAAAVRRAASVGFRGLSAVASCSLDWLDAAGFYFGFIDAESVRVCSGAGMALAVLCARQRPAPAARPRVHLPPMLRPLQPLLRRALGEGARGLEFADGDGLGDDGGAPLCLAWVGPGGPTLQLARELGGATRAVPMRVEVWCVLAQGWREEGDEREAPAAASAAAAAGRMGRASLGRLVGVDPQLRAPAAAPPLSMEPLHEALLRDASGGGVPCSCDELAYRQLCSPVRLLTWPPNGNGCDPVRLGERVEALVERGGELDTLITWCDVEVTRGVWFTRRPASCIPPRGEPAAARRERRVESRSSELEPHRAFPLSPRRVVEGEVLALCPAFGPDGVTVRLLGVGADATLPPFHKFFKSQSAPPPPLPAWTAAMMNDAARADGYSRALATAFDTLARETSLGTSASDPVVVVDIGAGVGLLSLLAARAAAASGLSAAVYAVERQPALAELARATFRANALHFPPGVALHVIQAESTELLVAERETAIGDADGRLRADAPSPPTLPCRAHLIVSEILGDDPLAEGLVPTFRHATHALLEPRRGVLIPARLSLRAALVALPPALLRTAALPDRVGRLGGGEEGLLRCLEPVRASLDLRSFRRLAEDVRRCDAVDSRGTAAGAEGIGSSASPPPECLATDAALLSEPSTLCTLDLGSLASAPPDSLEALACGSVASRLLPRAEAPAATRAALMWFEAHLADGVIVSSSPSSDTHWRQVVFPLPVQADAEAKAEAVGTVATEDVRFKFRVDEYESRVWLPSSFSRAAA